MNDTKRYTSTMKWAAPALMVLAQALNGCAADAPSEPVEASVTHGHDTKTKDWCPSGGDNCWYVEVHDDGPSDPYYDDPWTGYDPWGGYDPPPGDGNQGGGSGGSGGGDDPEQGGTRETYSGTFWDYESNTTLEAAKTRSRAEAKASCENARTPTPNGVTHCEVGDYVWGSRIVHTRESYPDCHYENGVFGRYVTCTTVLTVTILD